MPKSIADDAYISDVAASALSKDDVGPGDGVSRNARKKRRERLRKEAEALVKRATDGDQGKQWNSSSYNAAPPQGYGKNENPRKYGKLFVTDREGHEICYKHAKGGPTACPDPCSEGRTHCCQSCLGFHTNAQLPKNPGGEGTTSK